MWDRLVRHRPELVAGNLPADVRHAVVCAATRRIVIDVDRLRVRVVWTLRPAAAAAPLVAGVEVCGEVDIDGVATRSEAAG